MYDLVREYINLKITALNTGVTNPLVENDVFLEMEEMPANKKTYTYAVKFDSYDRKDDNETDAIYPVNVTIELNFGLFKKGLTEYENIIDDYVQPLAKLLSVSNSTGANIAYVSGNIALVDINKMSIEGLNDIVENSYLQPKIKFEITVIDQDTVPVATVGVPVLSTPADGYTTGNISNADFAWLEADNAVSYHFLLSADINFTTTLYEQINITYLNHTVSEGILSNDVQYYWRVRAKNPAGYGAWSDTRAFMCEATGEILPKTPLELGFFAWRRSDDIVSDVNGVSKMNDKTGNGNDLIQTDNAYKFSVSSFLGKQSIYNGTELWKQVYQQDSTEKYKLHLQAKTFFFTIVPKIPTPENAALCPAARTNTSYGSEWSCQRSNNYLPTVWCDGQISKGVVIPLLWDELIQVVITADGSNYLEVWVNGAKVSTGTATFQNVVPDGHAKTHYNLGSYYKATDVQGRFKGHILEDGWKDGVLPDADILSLYEYHKEFWDL